MDQQSRTAPIKYLLYIDMLGFSDFVLHKRAVMDLYKVIDSLNVHGHPNFKTLVFSDTILVYNKDTPANSYDRHYLIMYLCEFAQDLFYRLIGRDLHFRAYLTAGEFEHADLKNVEAFYGEALIKAHRREKEIQCTGLFIDNALLPDCRIFQTQQYDTLCSFVHLMQTLDNIRFDDAIYPLPSVLIDDTDLTWLLAYAFKYLQHIYQHMNNVDLAPSVRCKYSASWLTIRTRHRALLDTLESHGFDPRCVCQVDWTEAMRRVGTDEGFYR